MSQLPDLSLLTEDNFKTWLAAQPGDRAFDYCDPTGCLFASFIKEIGCFPNPHCLAGYWRENGGTGLQHPMPSFLYRLDTRVRDELPMEFTIDQVREMLRPKTFTVNVTRVSTSTKTFTVEATSEEEAKDLAVDQAANTVFSEQNAEYQAEIIS